MQRPRLQRCHRVRGALAAALLLACTWGAAAEPSAADVRRLDEALKLAGERLDQGATDECQAALAGVRETAWQLLGLPSNEWTFYMSRCAYWAGDRLKPGVLPADVVAFFEPWRLRFKQRSDSAPQAEMNFLFSYWRVLNQIELRSMGDELLLREVRQRVAAAQAQPADPAAAADLMFLARNLYGAWELHYYTKVFYDEFRQSLGPGHPVTLATLRALAYGERFHGRAQQAVQYAELAVALAEQHHPGNSNLRIGLVAERASSLATAGRPAEALPDLLWVRDVLLQRDPPPWEGLVRTHTNLAGLALDMGDYKAAVEYADQSTAYARRSGVPVLLVEARVPAAIREVSRLMLGAPGAAQALQAALEPMRDNEMHIGSEGFALALHAASVGDQAMLDWAIEYMGLYIRRFRTPFHSDRAVVPLMHGWQQAGIALQSPDVRADLDLALATSLTGRSLGTEALTHFSLARHLAPKQPDEAAWLYKRGANALQQLRQGLPTGNAELHRAWLAAHERDLRAFVGLLIDRGRLVEAEQAVLFLRDEEMVEYTRRSRARRSAPVQALPYTADEADRNVAFDALAQRVRDATAAADQRADEWRTLAPKSQYTDDAAGADAATFQREVHAILQPRAAPAAGAPQWRGVPTQTLPQGLARLTYFVRDSGIDIVVQQGRAYRSLAVPVARDDLNRRVQALRVAVGSPQRDALAPAQALHALLLAPVQDWLNANRATRLQIVPDASLRYVPFAALHDGQRYLAQRYVLSTDLSGSLPRGDEQAAAHGIVAFGRSVGDAEHAALPGVERELAALRRQRAAVALNGEFTAASLRTGLEQRPALVHIASHFELSPAGEDKSYLLLGDGQRLSLAELRQLPWRGVQLALLSACDSAVTVDAGNGRELVGFATALLGAGARNVLASLWRVSDGATAEWMETFYAVRARQPRPGVGPATLALTQRRWLQVHAGAALAHPHYWAAFSWIGTP